MSYGKLKNRKVIGILPSHGAKALVVDVESVLYISEQKVIVGFVVVKEPDGRVAVHPLGVKGMIESRDEDVEDIFILHADGTVEGDDPEGNEFYEYQSWPSLEKFDQYLTEVNKPAVEGS